MQINKKKITLSFILINLFLLAFGFAFYYFYVYNFNVNYKEDYIDKFQTILNEKSNEKLDELFIHFNDVTSRYELNDLNEMIETNQFTSIPYLEFIGNEDQDFLIYEEERIEIDKNYLKLYNLGITNHLMYVSNEDYIAVIDFNNYFLDIFSMTNATDILFMDNRGKIYFNNNDELSTNVLHEYLDIETDSYFNDYFSKNEDVVIKSKIKGKESLINFTKLNNYENLYIAQQFYDDDIKTNFFGLNTFVALILFLVLFISSIALNIIFYITDKKSDDIERAKIKHYYAKPYIIRINKHGKIRKINYRIEELFKQENVKNVKNIKDLILDDPNLMDKVKRGAGVTLNLETESVTLTPLKYRTGYYLIGNDKFEGDVASNEVYRIAFFDKVTGFPNRDLFEREVDAKIASFSGGLNENLHFIALELKTFKEYLSYLNKPYANQTLKYLAKDLKKHIDASGISSKAYHTEDNRMVIVVENTPLDEVLAYAQNLVDVTEEPVTVPNNQINVDLTAGLLTVLGTEGRDINANIIYTRLTETLRRAEGLKSTKNKIHVFDNTISYALTERQQMEKDLLESIENKAFIPYLQAQYDSRKDLITGFEALIRWDHPRYLNRSPQNFIELAEENGMIVDIGKIMIRKTFEAAKRLEKYDVTISVNVSPIELLRQGFTEEFLALFKEFDLKPRSIALEITETSMLTSFHLVNEKIKVLKRNGINIHLDDFGTGYSSLAYLKELQIDKIKIDKSFIDHIETDRYHRSLVNMIIQLSRALDVGVIAEGVETIAQLNRLERAGCRNIQGFLVSKAISIEEAEKLIEDFNIKKLDTFKVRSERK